MRLKCGAGFARNDRRNNTFMLSICDHCPHPDHDAIRAAANFDAMPPDPTPLLKSMPELIAAGRQPTRGRPTRRCSIGGQRYIAVKIGE